MKRRHGINTSHTKHLQPSQQQQQQQQQQEIQSTQGITEDPLTHSQSTTTTVQVII